ncbi:MAG: M1 family metallopeptidase [Candidatus Omnitrophica bacterium]|nr:M1 family metallopeptidase [Candidatus Omnitrophota bacterium]
MPKQSSKVLKSSRKAANPYRLDRNVLPQSYDLWIEPDLAKFKFEGRASIWIKAAKSFTSITLHAAELEIQHAALMTVEGVRIGSKAVRFDAKMETVTIEFARSFTPQETGTLELEFTGILNDQMHGFYRTSYDYLGKKTWGAATQFEATDARRAFPCWDEPDMKATFKVTLRVPKELTALSNMPIKQIVASGGKKEITYDATPIMSTYLLCFVVAHLEGIFVKDKNGVDIGVWTTPGKSPHGRFGLEVAKFCLPYFADWFGIPYSLPKLDMVALPDFSSGAMENWGLVTYRETALLVDPKNSSVAARQRVAEVIDHELAHQWFGNLVTMEWWTDLWLNEGFASFMGPKAVDAQFPQWKIWTQFLATEYLAALRDDSLKNTHAIEIDVKDPAEIREIFDHITYAKGSSVNRMLEHYLTEPVLRKGLKNYLKQYAYKNAKTVDLWKALEDASGKPVRAVMASYTRQGGYPVVSVEAAPAQYGAKRTLKLAQSRFLFDGSKDAEGASWQVPVTASVKGSAKRFETLLTAKAGTLKVEAPAGRWIKVNPGQSGFYRTAYSENLISPLAQGLKDGDFEPEDALGLLDDAFVLARAGRMKTSQVMELLSGCEREMDYNVWCTIVGILGQTEEVAHGDTRHRFNIWSRELLAWTHERLGWESKAKDNHLNVMLRALVIGRLGHYGYEPVVEQAVKRLSAFVKGGTLDPNLRGAVYGTAASHGDAKTLEQLMGIFAKSTLQEEKVRVLRSLTRFRDKSVTDQVLKFALSDGVRSQDRYVLLGGFGSNAACREQAWEFIKHEWKTVTSFFSGGNLGMMTRIIEGSTQGFRDESHAKDVEKFFSKHPVQGGQRAVQQSIEVIRANARWAARDRADLAAWLSKVR